MLRGLDNSCKTPSRLVVTVDRHVQITLLFVGNHPNRYLPADILTVNCELLQFSGNN